MFSAWTVLFIKQQFRKGMKQIWKKRFSFAFPKDFTLKFLKKVFCLLDNTILKTKIIYI